MASLSELTGSVFGSMTALDLLLHLVLKSSVFMVIGLSITSLTMRKSAASRHLVWMLAFSALALTPVLARLWPSEPVLIGDTAVQTNPLKQSKGDESGELPEFIVQQLQQRESGVSSSSGTAGETQMLESVTGAENQSLTPNDPEFEPDSHTNISWAERFQPWTPLLLGTWMSGVTALLSLLVIGQLELKKSRHGFQRVTNNRLLTVLKETVNDLGIKRAVALYHSSQQSIPMTWGVFSPAIWLPSSADDWSDERLRMVLLHELAHVRRLDCLWQAFALVTVIVHWFNPLVWFAAVKLRRECEQACDDVVLSFGVPGSDYAAQLLDISTGGRRGVLAMCAGLAMARTHGLTGRVQAIVDEDRNRSRVSRAAFVAFVITTVTLAVPVTLLTNVTFEARAAEVKVLQQVRATQPPDAVQRLEPQRKQHTVLLSDGSTFGLSVTHQPFVDAAIRLVESASVEVKSTSPVVPEVNVTLTLHTPQHIRSGHEGSDVMATEIIVGTRDVLGPNHILVRTGKQFRVFAKYQFADWVAFHSELVRLQHHSSPVIAKKSGEWSKPVNGLAACLNVDPRLGVLLELRNRSDANSMNIPVNVDRLEFRLFDSNGIERPELLLPMETTFGRTGDIRIPFGSPLKIPPNSSVGIVGWSETGVMLVFYNPEWLGKNNNGQEYSLGVKIEAPQTNGREAWHGILNVPPVPVRFIRHEQRTGGTIEQRRYSIRDATGPARLDSLNSVFPQRASLTFSLSDHTNEMVVRGPASQVAFAGQVINALNSAKSHNSDSTADAAPNTSGPPWGEAIEGIRIRARPESSTWSMNSSPEFQLDVRNDSETDFFFVRNAKACSLEIDGRWYWQRRTTERGLSLKSGDAQNRVIILPIGESQKWIDKLRGTPLQLSAGRHTLRVALACDREFPSREPVSNPVEFVILPDDAVSAEAPTEPRSRIYSFKPDADKSSVSLVADENTVPGREFLGAPTMSHDENWVVFDATEGRTFSQTHLVKVAVAGPDKGEVVDLGFGVCGVFSPDDTQIAFFLNNNVPSGEERGIWVMDADGSNRRRVTNGCHPHWSPDGKSLLTVTSFRSPRQLTLVEVATGKRTWLLRNEIVLGQPAWSPDGEQIAITVKDDDDRVMCLFKPTREPTDRQELWRQPFSQKYEETWPDWSPDGKSVVFTVWDRKAGGIVVCDVTAESGERPQRVNSIPHTTSIRDCQWTTDGKRILFATDSEAIHALATAL